MIGRGCYGRPWFLAQAAHFLRTGIRLPEPSLAQQKDILLGHYRLMLSQFGTGPGVRLARKHLSWYSRGLPGSAEFRATMNRLPDADSVLRLIDSFYDPLIARGATRVHIADRDDDAWLPGGAHDRSRSSPRVPGLAAPPRPARRDAAAMLGALPVPVMLLDPENRFRHVNQAAEQFLGISAASLAPDAPAGPDPAGQPAVPADRAGAQHRGHHLRPRPRPRKPAAAQARHHRAGLAAAGGTGRRCCW